MHKIFEIFLPNDTSEYEKTSIRILQYYLCFNVLACFTTATFISFYPSGDNTPFALIGGISVLLLVFLKYTGAKIIIGNIFIGIWAIILVDLSFDTGGIYSMDTLSIALLPLISFAIINYKSGVAWFLFYLGYLYYLWMLIDSPEMNEFYRTQTEMFDKNYYTLGNVMFSTFTFFLFLIFFFQNKKLLSQLKENQTILKKHVEQLDRQSILLKQTQEDLKRSNTELEEFAHVTSHDLKQPLRTVNNFANLLQNHLGRKELLDEETTQMLQFIVGGTSKMNTLITDLLAFAKLKKEADIAFEQINLDALLQSVLFDLKTQIDASEVTIHMPRLPTVEVIPVKMNQLFQNLISNAIKFRKQDRVCIIKIGVREQATHWEFSIKDNGIGIKKEYQESIFDPFKKLHNNSAYEGAGIGLATCMHIVKLHKGEIWVESNFGEETTFYFTIAKDLATASKEKKTLLAVTSNILETR